MALPNEHPMTLNQYEDTKTLFAAIETRSGRNEATKKSQKTLLKQLYEKFSATSTESLDSIFNRLQKIRNKSDVDTMSIDDLYNNFKIVEQETGKKITINGSDTAGYDKAKVECFNCHKMGHFSRECRVPRNQENKTKNQETTRRTVNVEDTSSKVMVEIDGPGFDWSYMADDEAPTNMAFMALSDSKTSSVKISKPVTENNGAPIIKDMELKGEDEEIYPTSLTSKSLMKGMLHLGDELKVMCDKRNIVLFTDTECFVLSPDFKLANESYVLLKVSRKNNMYRVDMKNIIPKEDLTCLVAKATNDESMLWHRRLGHINFKIMNKLVKENLVRDEGFFVGYSTTSNTFRVYNTRTRKVEENLHIKFLENKPIIIGKGASFDADSDGDNKDNNGLSTESEIDNQERPNAENNTKDVNTIRPSIYTASSNINTGSLTINNFRQSDDFFGADNDMRSLDEVEMDISNISTTYLVPTTLNTRIHKDHSLDNVMVI
uniref:Ribonuclease H-like domain-containing protein n=1 Tax=Tanacetum cinerariifolium TaxID=118510 RepID=A0A6L2LVW2_TANCI|nr:ribonuclease H-like domain-containing protein [Tanacetum cinerariifolium]